MLRRSSRRVEAWHEARVSPRSRVQSTMWTGRGTGRQAGCGWTEVKRRERARRHESHKSLLSCQGAERELWLKISDVIVGKVPAAVPAAAVTRFLRLSSAREDWTHSHTPYAEQHTDELSIDKSRPTGHSSERRFSYCTALHNSGVTLAYGTMRDIINWDTQRMKEA